MIGRRCKASNGFSRPVLIARNLFCKPDRSGYLSQVKYCGGYSGEDPPLPIPNREVKLTSADGTATPSGRVGSCRFSGHLIEDIQSGVLFLYPALTALLPSLRSALRRPSLLPSLLALLCCSALPFYTSTQEQNRLREIHRASECTLQGLLRPIDSRGEANLVSPRGFQKVNPQIFSILAKFNSRGECHETENQPISGGSSNGALEQHSQL